MSTPQADIGRSRHKLIPTDRRS